MPTLSGTAVDHRKRVTGCGWAPHPVLSLPGVSSQSGRANHYKNPRTGKGRTRRPHDATPPGRQAKGLPSNPAAVRIPRAGPTAVGSLDGFAGQRGGIISGTVPKTGLKYTGMRGGVSSRARGRQPRCPNLPPPRNPGRLVELWFTGRWGLGGLLAGVPEVILTEPMRVWAVGSKRWPRIPEQDSDSIRCPFPPAQNSRQFFVAEFWRWRRSRFVAPFRSHL